MARVPAAAARGERIVAVGVDGYRAGWVAVTLREGPTAAIAAFADFGSVLEAAPDADAIGVDIPIGLPGAEPRAADVEARRLLGRRASVVFPTFPRRVLTAGSHAEAVRIGRSLGWNGISQQAFALRHRIFEVEAHAADPRVLEVHPEVSFAALAGKPIDAPKRTWPGVARRLRLLEHEGIVLEETVAGDPTVPVDDVLDAAAAAWSAARYARGEAMPLPEGATERIGAIWR